jgi:hypothetical protein
MAKTLAELRKVAKELGITPAVIRGATSADELASVIADHRADSKPKAAAKKKVAAKKKGNSSSGRKSAPVKSTKKSGTTKRQTTTVAKGSNGYVPKGGRNLLDGVDFTETDGWNARENSAPARIIAALRKARGNREKAFDALKGNIHDFVSKKMADGSKRSKADSEKMLRYRIARTAWDFAIKTGQHDIAENRVEYGTGGTGEGVFKRRKSSGNSKTKSAPARKSSARKSAGRKAAASKKRGEGRKTASRKR